MMKKWMMFVLVGVAALSLADSPEGWDKKEYFGRRLYDQEKDTMRIEKLDADVYGIYFSAHWCPPCRGFTPSLVDFYNEVKAAGGKFEILFVSSDHSEDDMFRYMDEMEMPWLAMEYKCSEADDLKKRYEVRGIPSLIILDSTGKVITKGGRQAVQSLGIKAWDEWIKVDGEQEESTEETTEPSE